jgi:NADH dehydrogenase
MHRGYHGMAVPTWNRKIRVFADWTLGMFLKREVVSLGAIENPREEFYEAARPAAVPAARAEQPKAAAGATAEKAGAA